MSLRPSKCASEPFDDLVIVLDMKGEGYCYNRDDLVKEARTKCDIASSLLIKNFKNFVIFQKYIMYEKCYYRPIKGTIREYMDGLLQKSLVFTEGDKLRKTILGEGAFGEVSVSADSEVAVKISTSTFFENMDVILEFSIMKELNSAVCCIAGAYELNVNAGLVSLYMKRMSGDLMSMYNKPIVKNNIRKIMYQLCKGVYYAHSKGICHRDIKMENILIDAAGDAYLADWGLACYAPFAMKNSNVVTLSYRAPEIWGNMRYTCNIDVFSLGLILVEIIAGIPHSLTKKNKDDLSDGTFTRDASYYGAYLNNMYGIKDTEALSNIFKNRHTTKHLQDKVRDKVAYDLFKNMTNNIPSERYSISEALNHSYFDSVREEKFPEITPSSILENSPILTRHGSKNKPFTKLTAINNSHYIHDMKGRFIFMALYNMIPYHVTMDHSRVNGVAMLSCAIIALSASDTQAGRNYLEGKSEEFNVTYDTIAKNVYIVSDMHLTYNVIGTIPIVYFKTINPKAVEMLLLFELSSYENVHPYSVAKFVAETCEVEYIKMSFEPRESPEVINALIEASRKEHTPGNIDVIVKNLLQNRFYSTVG
jgi:serine/threonine protein kinase